MENKQVLALFRELKEESLALQFTCAVLMAELAARSKDPKKEVDHIATSIRGATAGLAAQSAELGISTETITKVIDRIAEMAEAGLE